MPLFEFECSRCDLTFEELIRAGEKGACPTCGSSDVRKLVSAPARHAQGSSLPVLGSACPPQGVPPCGPGCCRLP